MAEPRLHGVCVCVCVRARETETESERAVCQKQTTTPSRTEHKLVEIDGVVADSGAIDRYISYSYRYKSLNSHHGGSVCVCTVVSL